jgi:hypothetical protein
MFEKKEQKAMARLGKNGTKLLKILHYVALACWFGGATTLVLLNRCNEAAVSEGMLPGMNTAAHLADLWVIIPGALGCLATGLAFSLFTPWGFFRHGWLTCKWVLTVACILTGTFFLGVWEEEMLAASLALGNAALADGAYQAVRTRHFLLACAQVGALLLMIVLSVFRPKKR